MTRVPTVAGDVDGWGQVLNDFLGVSHDATGSLTSAAVTAAIGGSLPVINPSGDVTGVTDTAAINAKLALGNVALAKGAWYTNQTIRHTVSNSDLVFHPGAVLNFVPTAPFLPVVNDRAIFVHSEPAARNQIAAGAIAVGATSFTAQSGAAAATLTAGDWVMITEYDPTPSEIVLIDWVQVRSVVAAVVNIEGAFRTAFPNSRAYVQATSGLGFQKVNLLENCGVIGARIVQPDAGATNVSIGVGVAKDTRIENCFVANARGNAFYSYRSKGLRVRGCKQAGSFSQASEFASTVDLVIEQSEFGFEGTVQANTSALVLDYGTAFFTVTGCPMPQSADICVQLSYVHDGVFAFNPIGWVRKAAIDAIGINGLGCQRVKVLDNILAGGEGVASRGIVFSSSSGLSVAIVSRDNLIAFNDPQNFVSAYGALVATDTYLIGPASGHLALPGSLMIGASTDPVQPLDLLGNARLLGLVGVGLNPSAAARLQVADDPATNDLFYLQSTNATNPRIFKGGPGTGGGTQYALYDVTGAVFAHKYNWATNLTSFPKRVNATSFYTDRVTLAYSATIATDAALSEQFDITATNGTAFTISNPTNPQDSQRITYTIRNTSGGALGAITWGAAFKQAWVSPATGFSRSITFRYDATRVVWDEIGRTPADVPN